MLDACALHIIFYYDDKHVTFQSNYHTWLLVKIKAYPGSEYQTQTNLRMRKEQRTLFQKEYYHKERNGFTETSIYLADA